MNDYLNLQKDNKPELVEKLEATKTEIESNYNKYVEASATIQYQVQKNKDKFNSIMDYINYLEKRIKRTTRFLNYQRYYQEKIVKIDA